MRLFRISIIVFKCFCVTVLLDIPNHMKEFSLQTETLSITLHTGT